MPQTPFFKQQLNNCNQIQDNLFSYLDGELAQPVSRIIEAHLENCALCRAELDACRLAETALQSAHRTLPAPRDLSAGFYAKLHQQQRHPARLFPLFRLGVPVAAGLLLIGLCIPLVKRSQNAPVEVSATPNSASNPGINNLERGGTPFAELAPPSDVTQKNLHANVEPKKQRYTTTNRTKSKRERRPIQIASIRPYKVKEVAPSSTKYTFGALSGGGTPVLGGNRVIASSTSDNSTSTFSSERSLRLTFAHQTTIRVYDEDRNFSASLELAQDSLDETSTTNIAVPSDMPTHPSELPALP